MDIPALTLGQLLFGGVLPTFESIIRRYSPCLLTCPLCEAFMGDFAQSPTSASWAERVCHCFPFAAVVLPALGRLSAARDWYRIGRQIPVHPAFGLLRVRPIPHDGLEPECLAGPRPTLLTILLIHAASKRPPLKTSSSLLGPLLIDPPLTAVPLGDGVVRHSHTITRCPSCS